MKRSRPTRFYALGLLALVVAFSTAGYFWAGQVQNRSSQRTQAVPQAVARIAGPNGSLELPVYRLVGGIVLPRRNPQPDGAVLYSFRLPRDDGWTGQGLKTPISAVFLDGQGKVLAILEVEPCSGNNCPVYQPGVAYRQVLEVSQGWFAQNRVGLGATVHLEAVP